MRLADTEEVRFKCASGHKWDEALERCKKCGEPWGSMKGTHVNSVRRVTEEPVP